MSVSTIINSVEEAGNGVKVAFDFAFKILAATDLIVKKKLADGSYTVALTLNVDYTVAFDSVAQTGTVTYSVAPVGSGGGSKIQRSTDHLQSSVYPREGVTPAKVTETALDKLTLEVQDTAIALALISTPIRVDSFVNLDAAATTVPFLGIVTDLRIFAIFMGDRALGNNGWATIGGF